MKQFIVSPYISFLFQSDDDFIIHINDLFNFIEKGISRLYYNTMYTIDKMGKKHYMLRSVLHFMRPVIDYVKCWREVLIDFFLLISTT